MPVNLRGRSVLKLLDFTPDEIRFLLKLSASLKQAKYGGYEEQRLKGKNVALIFEKDRRAHARVSRWPPMTGRPRYLSRANRHPDRQEGVDEGYRPRSRADV